MRCSHVPYAHQDELMSSGTSSQRGQCPIVNLLPHPCLQSQSSPSDPASSFSSARHIYTFTPVSSWRPADKSLEKKSSYIYKTTPDTSSQEVTSCSSHIFSWSLKSLEKCVLLGLFSYFQMNHHFRESSNYQCQHISRVIFQHIQLCRGVWYCTCLEAGQRIAQPVAGVGMDAPIPALVTPDACDM